MSPSEKQPDPESFSLFSHLLMMLTTSAMQQLGMMGGADGNPPRADLEGAQITIDLIDMLKQKTQGNLTPDEERLLRESLTSLQMLYVEAAKARTGGPSDQSEPATEAPSAEPAPEPAASPEPGPESDTPSEPGGNESADEKVKFKKSYG